MPTDSIISVFFTISEKKKKDSEGTPMLPLYLLVKISYSYPKELSLDKPSNSSSAVPQ